MECHRILKENGELVLSVPEGYVYFRELNRLKQSLNKEFGAVKGYYNRIELVNLLEAHDFHVLEVEYAPKRVGSFFYEFMLYLQCMGCRLPEIFMFLFFFPIAYLDRFDRRNAKGCELVIRARAANP